jgi:hypothetical protein
MKFLKMNILMMRRDTKMALPITPTPVLKGRDAQIFQKRIHKRNWGKKHLPFNPKFQVLTEELLKEKK